MKAIPLLLFGGAAALLAGGAETLPDQYAPSGQLILTQFVSAPFPHPARAEGHKHKDQLFPAQDHYRDSTVALFIPRGFRETGRNDFVIHFHGWGNNVEGVLKGYRLIEQLVASRRNAILIVPQGPRNASDSFGGKLEDTNGFKLFMAEAVAALRQRSALKVKNFTLGNVVLSGHSGGYQVISSILDHGGLTGRVREVWLFDALYARTERFLAWFDQHHGRWLDIYTERGGTKRETEKLIAILKGRGTPFWAGAEGEAQPAILKTVQPIFLHTELAHNRVLDGHNTFQQFLETSCLQSAE